VPLIRRKVEDGGYSFVADYPNNSFIEYANIGFNEFGLLISFEPGIINPGAEGPIELHTTWEESKPLFSTYYKTLFGLN